MSGKPIILRERALRDIDEVAEHYLARPDRRLRWTSSTPLKVLSARSATSQRVARPAMRTSCQ